jgi:hypothetical protein
MRTIGEWLDDTHDILCIAGGIVVGFIAWGLWPW